MAEGAEASGTSTAGLLGGLLIVTVLAAGAGGIAGLQGLRQQGESATKMPANVAAPAQARSQRMARLEPLPPIVTNLKEPGTVWARLESAIIVGIDAESDAKMLAAKIADDFVAFLRTVPLRQIEGASGFQHLREDLMDRARIRSQGRVEDLVIHSLIVE